MPNDEERIQPEVSRVAIKLPPFWKIDPELWFIQIEAQFSANRITADTTKYNYVVGAIESEVLTQVSDFIKNPPAENKYSELKKRIIIQFSETEEKKIK